MEREEAITFVEGLLAKQKQVEEYTKSAAQMQLSIEQTNRTMTSYRERIDDEANLLIRTKREELTAAQERRVRTARSRYQQAQKKRSRAKNKQVKDLIAEENAEDRNEIVMIKRQIKKEMMADRIPGYCNSKLWFTLFMPGSLMDYVKLVLFFAFNCVLLPLIVYMMVPDRATWYLYLILPVFVIVTCFIYELIAKKTVGKHKEVLKLVQEKRKKIDALNAQMDKTREDILFKDDESTLTLTKHDTKLDKYKKELDEALETQTQKLTEFEHTTREQILEEFRQKSETKLTQMKNHMDESAREKNRCLAESAKLHSEILTQAGELIGEQNLTSVRLERILTALKQKNVPTLEIAVAIAENGRDDKTADAAAIAAGEEAAKLAGLKQAQIAENASADAGNSEN